MKKMKLKIIVKMRKIDNFKDNNYDGDCNDDECEVRQMKIGQEDEANDD